ncbi:formin-binding protein [Massospora cicadina]|nr:formin-binding protein [Massospora cicadina]
MNRNRENSPTYHNQHYPAFEGTDSRRLEAWRERYRATKGTCSDLESFFTLRAQLEEEFSQRLLSLSRQKLGDFETGHLASSLKAVRKEVEASAAAHLQLASRIRQELLQPSSQQAAQLAKVKRGFISQLFPKKQAQSNQLFLLERSKERYQEAQQAGGDAARLGADQELQLAAARYEDLTHHLQVEEERALEGFRQLELTRVHFIRNILWKYTDLLSGNCVTDHECFERVRGVLESCDANAEVDSLSSTLDASCSPEENGLANGPSDYQTNLSAHADGKQTTLPDRGSSLRNEGRVPNDHRFNQLVPSGRPVSETPFRNGAQGVSNLPAPDRTKLISSDLVSASIARSPILAAKRCSSRGRQVPRANSAGPGLSHPLNPSSLATRPPAPNPGSTPETCDTAPTRGNSVVDRNPSLARSNPSSRSISPPDGRSSPSENDGPQRTFSGSSQPYVRPPYGAQPQYYPPYNTTYGGAAEHVRHRTPSPPSAHPVPKASARPDSRPILFYVKAVYDYDAELPEEIGLREGQLVAVLATQLDGWWEGEVQDGNSVRRGIFPSNFTEPVSL